MERREALAGVIEAITEQFFLTADEVSEQSSASDIDGWGSLSHVTLILQMERRFGVRLPIKRTTEASNVCETD